MIFDSHAHYDDQRFDADRDEVLASMPQRGVEYIVNCASDIESARMSLEIAKRYSFIYAAVGVHPHEAAKVQEGYIDTVRSLAQDARAVAIGEIGLDYHYDFSPRDVQKRVFEEQVTLANELEMPVIVHDREAHADTLEILKRLRPKGIVHCFSGSAEMARELTGLGFYIGFTGAITFKDARRPLEALRAVPEDRLLLETDCPYMAPVPMRGKRCESDMIAYTAAAAAAVLSVSVEELTERTNRNARRVFGI